MSEPKTVSGRTLSLIYLTVFMFLYTSYSANIVALLQSNVPVSSLEELLNSRIEVGAQDVYYMKYYLTNAKDNIRKELYSKKIGANGYYSEEVGVDKIRQGFFAFHGEVSLCYSIILEKFTDYEVCGLQLLDGYVNHPGGYNAVPKNSPYKEIAKVGYLKIEEYGIRRRNFNRVHKTPKCYSGSASVESVGIIDAYPAMIIWLYGVALAWFVFATEKIVYRVVQKKKPSLVKHLSNQ